MSDHPIRILLAKPGLDVHDRGIRVVANACRDAGMEVVYLATGVYATEEIAQVAVDEDVNVVGLSIMTGRANRFCEELLAALAERGGRDLPVVAGGVIRKEEVPGLEALGVAGVFRAGAPLAEIVEQIRQVAANGAPGCEA